MRLDKEEQKAFENAIKDVSGEVYLFGSRVHDTSKGGDIDILILSKDNPFALSHPRSKISVDFFMECEEEKIDVIVMDPDNLNRAKKAFLNTLIIIADGNEKPGSSISIIFQT